jgi:polyketide biosynthesis acyl carrier protein
MDKKQIFEIISSHARQIVPSLESRAFKIDDALKDLGANSIDRSEISMMTLETLSLRIPLVELGKARNIGELVDIIHAKLQQA